MFPDRNRARFNTFSPSLLFCPVEAFEGRVRSAVLPMRPVVEPLVYFAGSKTGFRALRSPWQIQICAFFRT